MNSERWAGVPRLIESASRPLFLQCEIGIFEKSVRLSFNTFPFDTIAKCLLAVLPGAGAVSKMTGWMSMTIAEIYK
jgi:hypothetical protein